MIGETGCCFYPTQSAIVSVTKTFTGSNTTVAVPIFKVTGVIKITKLWGIVSTTLGANHTAAHWRLNDATITVPITKVTGVTISAYPVGSAIYRADLAVNAALATSSATGAVIEPTAKGAVVSTEIIVVPKNGVVTNIEYVYTTTETPTTGAITFFAEYLLRSGSSPSLTAI